MIYYKRKSSLIAKKIQNEYIVIDPNSGSYYLLNETSEFIYHFLKKQRSIEEITKKMTETYKVSAKKAKIDTEDFIIRSLKSGIVKLL